MLMVSRQIIHKIVLIFFPLESLPISPTDASLNEAPPIPLLQQDVNGISGNEAYNSTMICVYKFSLIILESAIEEFSARIDACHDDVKDFPAPQTPLTVTNVDDTVNISSEF